jgi:hypothetical protein
MEFTDLAATATPQRNQHKHKSPEASPEHDGRTMANTWTSQKEVGTAGHPRSQAGSDKDPLTNSTCSRQLSVLFFREDSTLGDARPSSETGASP